MRKYAFGIGWAVLALTITGLRVDAAPARARPGSLTLEAESARLDPLRAEIVAQDTFPSRRGVSLKAGATANVGTPATQPDLVFQVKTPQAGRYWIRTHAATDAQGTETMRRAASKTASLRLMVSVGGSRPTKRVVFVPWSPAGSCTQAIGKFEFTGAEQDIRIWLPAGLRLDGLQIVPYTAPKIPPEAGAYRPAVVPPASRPRLWVNAQSLPEVRARLDRGENAPSWAKLRRWASKPLKFQVAPDAEVGYNTALETAAASKAFVHLMTGDRALGREAVALVRDYLAAVQFDNLLDITREIGRAIYCGALVYDWCYDVMTPDDRDSIRKSLMRLADDMEIGWPPFLQSIVNGHGNEAQINRDLLSMAIAVYDEDPLPYRYCAYRVLEELVPMRKFEYQSPRHNQGVSYGPYRFGWDMHAAVLFQRMTGKPVFDPNIGEVFKFWLYMRLPHDQMLRDGDGFSDGRPVNLGLTPLLVYAYTGDPIAKGDFLRQNGLAGDPLMVLLLNDPDLKPEPSLALLPPTLDFGPVLGSMVARTGWDFGPKSTDVVVEMKGGGYHFGNHQHCDAGSFQIYYRGLQAVDLGQYHFYGTPYDSGFCKRSVAHSMLFAVDPNEKFPGTPANDGGTRFVRTCPRTPQQATSDPMFANGRQISSSFGPSAKRPAFSYFAVDLKSAYSDKIREYVRTFCFLTLDDPQTPAVLVVLDNMTTAKPEFKKYWQVNTLNPPQTTADGVTLRNTAGGLNGRVDVRMLRPTADQRRLEILSGADAYSVFGQPFTPPDPKKPEANGHRVVFSPKTAQARDVFLTVMPIADAQAPQLPVTLVESPTTFTLTLGDRVVVLSKTGRPVDQAFSVSVAGDRSHPLLLAGLAPGRWEIRGQDGTLRIDAPVEAGRNTTFVVVPGGRITVCPPERPKR